MSPSVVTYFRGDIISRFSIILVLKGANEKFLNADKQAGPELALEIVILQQQLADHIERTNNKTTLTTRRRRHLRLHNLL